MEPRDLRIEPVNVAADSGSAGHEVMRRIVEMDLSSTDDVDHVSIARMYSVDEDELKIQAFVGVRVWKEIRAMFPEAQAEVALQAHGETWSLFGHADLLTVDHKRKVAHVADWKFGRLDGDHRHQLAAYSALVLLTYQDLDRVDSVAVWMRDGDVEPYSMDRVQMEAWLERFEDLVVKWDGVYRPGPHCAGCSRRHQCPARTAMVRADVEMLASPEMAARIAAGLADVPDAQVVELRRKAKSLKAVLDSLDDAIKFRVEQAGGALSDGAGRELRFVESATRKVDPTLATPVMEEFLTDEEIAACITVHASKLDDAIASKTERGKKKAAIEEFGAALRAAGAVTEEKKQRLEDRKAR